MVTAILFGLVCVELVWQLGGVADQSPVTSIGTAFQRQVALAVCRRAQRRLDRFRDLRRPGRYRLPGDLPLGPFRKLDPAQRSCQLIIGIPLIANPYRRHRLSCPTPAPNPSSCCRRSAYSETACDAVSVFPARPGEAQTPPSAVRSVRRLGRVHDYRNGGSPQREPGTESHTGAARVHLGFPLRSARGGKAAWDRWRRLSRSAAPLAKERR